MGKTGKWRRIYIKGYLKKRNWESVERVFKVKSERRIREEIKRDREKLRKGKEFCWAHHKTWN